jgi:asparagine synthase (glutamine-hydrolysing)
MWAFSIWNNQTNELFCSRDRFGIKPFYYIFESNAFYFSSEIKSLRLSPRFTNDLNLSQVNKAIQMGWMYSNEETMFEKIVSLPAGHNLVFKNGEIRLESYWNIDENRAICSSEEEYVSKFKSLFNESIDLHLRSDVPLGATLSGGIDSSSIVCNILKNKKVENLKTYSIFYTGQKGVDERPFVEDIQRLYPNQFETIYYSPSANTIKDQLHDITFHCDFPLLGSSPISQYFIMQRIKEDGIKVILSGQGADDYLGGYMHSFYRLFADQMKGFQVNTFVKDLLKYKSDQGYGFPKVVSTIGKSLLSVAMSEKYLYQLEQNHYYPKALKESVSKQLHLQKLQSSNKFNSFHEVLMKYSSLPSLLHYEDRNSMAASIESRVPFLDHRLVDLAFSMPSQTKIKNATTKWVLREAMSDVLPSTIRYRKDKKGFVTPGEVLWLRNDLKNLLEIDYQKLDFLDSTEISKSIHAFKHGDDSKASYVWRIANLNYWVKNFV